MEKKYKETFKNTLKKRITFLNSFNCIALFFILFAGYFGNLSSGGPKELAGTIRSFQVGLFIGFELIFVFYIGKYRKAIKSEALLNRLYIEENDERNKLIQDKIGRTGFNFVMAGVGTATIVSGFINQTVFFTLLAVLLFVALVKGSLKIYYRKKA